MSEGTTVDDELTVRAITMGLSLIASIDRDGEVGLHAKKILIQSWGLKRAKEYLIEAYKAISGAD